MFCTFFVVVGCVIVGCFGQFVQILLNLSEICWQRSGQYFVVPILLFGFNTAYSGEKDLIKGK
jgi:hypothetical protein